MPPQGRIGASSKRYNRIMLYVIAGGDAGMRTDKRRALTLRFEELKWEGMSAEELATIASTPTLTGEKRAFMLAGALGSDRDEEFLALASGLAESPHVFLFEEEKLLKAPLVALERAGATVQVLKAEPKEKFNAFALAGALGSRDRKKLWLLLMDAFRRGTSPEAVAGMLAWKARTACASARGAERAAWEKLSRSLVVMYHEGHRGGGELELLLERFALTL